MLLYGAYTAQYSSNIYICVCVLLHSNYHSLRELHTPRYRSTVIVAPCNAKCAIYCIRASPSACRTVKMCTKNQSTNNQRNSKVLLITQGIRLHNERYKYNAHKSCVCTQLASGCTIIKQTPCWNLQSHRSKNCRPPGPI